MPPQKNMRPRALVTCSFSSDMGCPSPLELGVKAKRHDRHRTAICVVRRVVGPLEIDTARRPRGERQAVEKLDDLLGRRMRQPAVTHEYSQSPGVEVALARRRDAIHHTAETDGIVLSPPASAAQGQSHADSA